MCVFPYVKEAKEQKSKLNREKQIQKHECNKKK